MNKSLIWPHNVQRNYAIKAGRISVRRQYLTRMILIQKTFPRRGADVRADPARAARIERTEALRYE
jgi:hypothetical protein